MRERTSGWSLPTELAMNILSRLPAKSLGQIKCVCKSFRSLISDPQFVKLHLIQASSDAKTNHFKIFMMYPFYSMDYESPSSFLEDEDHEAGSDALVDLGFPYSDEDREDLVGSCNGLVCLLYCPNMFLIWNPTTRETKEVNLTLGLSSDDIILYGFCYASSMEDYRLLIGIPLTTSNENLFEIFSLKDNTWTKVQEELPNSVTFSEKMGLFASCALHWEATRGVDQQSVIVSFDLLRGKFGEISPPEIADKTVITRTIGVPEGCLSYVSHGRDEMVIWVMNEYGVGESWTKLGIIGLMDIMFCCHITPVCMTKKGGEIIINLDGIGRHPIRYNLLEKTYQELKNRCDQWYQSAVYVESLESFNS